MSAGMRMRLVLLGEALLYGLVAFLLAQAGWAAGAIVLAVVTLALTGRAMMVAGTYAFMLAYRSPMPGEKAGGMALLTMVLEEYWSYLYLFSFIQPLENFFMPVDRLDRPIPGRLPVLLIHGYQCNRSAWYRQRTRIENAGWTVATITLRPVFAAIDDYAGQIHRRIEAVCRATGASQVIMVGHSMGGLAARAYLRAHGNARVAKLITVGTPHHGSQLARLGLGPNARQMLPNSEWLEELNAPGATPWPEDTVSAYSRYDNYVMPQTSPLLEDARNIDLGPVGHESMLTARRVADVLIAEISRT